MKKLLYTSARTITRPLHHWGKGSGISHEVAIVNNSGLFFTLASLRKHHKKAHPNLNVVIPNFWLDGTHPDYDDLDWGQTPLGLPWYIRNNFSAIFKSHSKRDYITWGQYKELREDTIKKIKSLGVQVWTGTPRIDVDGTQYIIHANEGSFTIPIHSSHIYNSFRKPELNHGLSELKGGVFRRSHTQIYQYSRNEVEEKSFVIVGTNRSAIWVAKHFPVVPFACLGFYHPRNALFTDEKLPENITYYPKEKNMAEYSIRMCTDNEGTVIISSTGTTNDFSNFSGDFFCSIGLSHVSGITKTVPVERLTLYPVSDTELEYLGNWIAPEELPIGGLAEATSRWAYVTNNINWAYEVHSYHKGTTIDPIAKKFESNGISLSYRFFDELSKKVIKERYVPDTDRIIELYQSSYRKVNPRVTEKKLSEIKKLLERIDIERTQHFSTLADTDEEVTSKGKFPSSP